MKVLNAQPEDLERLEEFWDPTLGPLSTAWYRYTHSSATADGREKWLVVVDEADTIVATVHFSIRKRDGVRRVAEIVVAPEARRTGIAQMLMEEYVGRPCWLKTDADNGASNAFYRRIGMQLERTVMSKSGKPMNVWVW